MYPQLQNALKYWNDYELTKGGNQDSLIENSRPNEDQVSISSNDVSDSMFQFLPTWLSRNEQQKRAYRKYHLTTNSNVVQPVPREKPKYH